MSKKMSNANAQEVVVLTKSAAIWNLVKHIGVILICCVAAMALLSNDFGGGSWFMGLFLAGIPFGFRTMKSVIISNSLTWMLILLLVAMIIGWIALPIVLTKDIIALVRASKEEKQQVMQA